VTGQHSRGPNPSTHRVRPSWWERIRRAERHRAADRRRGSLTWRLVTPAAFAGAGLLVVTSGINSGGTDLRAGRYDDLTDLARVETERVQELRAEITTLNEDVARLTERVQSNRQLAALQDQVADLEMVAGVAAVEGPGVTVVLDDAPREIVDEAGELVNEAIVHQQDLQAVANALWAGGAEAMTIQGQRVVSTTGIKCIGNTVRLQDVPYSPPYVISAVGNPETLLSSINTNPYIASYLDAVDEWHLGWEARTESLVEAPAYTGPLEMRYARVPRTS
jgi:uncharacterized protein YlxW (UPF0749 family)